MNTQKFWCYPGNITLTPVEIDIPTHCPICNMQIAISPYKANGASYFSVASFNPCCRETFRTYPSIWAAYGPQAQAAQSVQITYPDGVVCKKCGGRNHYGEPNRPDGTYLCYECK